MKVKYSILATFVVTILSLSGADFLPRCSGLGQAQGGGQAAVARRIGAIKAINGNAITLTPDSGPDVAVTVQPNARILRIAPGEKDLKNAAPVQLQDLQVGDRVRVRGQASADGTSIAAMEVIVIPHTDLQALHEKERLDWQKRGLGGLVRAVDPGTGTITISVTSLGGKKEIAVHTSKSTVFRRYAPDSVKFDDAKPSTLQEIQAGDQLRARGDRSPDGSDVTAEEIVTGSFRNVAGLVNAVDASSSTITVQDLLSKKPVQVKITSDSQLHKLPPEMAQRIAARLKASMGAGGTGTSGSNSSAAPAGNGQPSGAPAGANASGGGMAGGGMHHGGSPDFQQMLNRMPAVTLADLHKGDAVLVVTTQGTTNDGGTAITLLSGVEPILQAAPSGSQAMMLAPWSLGGAPGGDASQ
ncbi:MAG TPA: DUF5666 domain-containing protein [Candidatus Sulfotelmatobacter sp.]|jgi:hypothetical protein|nr:DUF5666 domain-containing protein [Candidatus Sulfotelmatobacter sp.]